MKKLILFLLPFVGFGYSYAQITTDPNTGYVGLKTTTPVYPLHVAQDVTMNTDINIGQAAITGSADQTKRLVLGYDVNGAGFGFIKAGWYQRQWTNLSLQPNGGNVGIGTVTPSEKLSVSGAISVTGVVAGISTSSPQPNTSYIDYWSGSSASRFLATGPNTTTYGQIKLSQATSDASGYREVLTVLNNGKVAIGATYAFSALDVPDGISMGQYAHLSSSRTINNNFTNVFIGGAIRYKQESPGSYQIMTDGTTNYFGAIDMDAAGGNSGAINFYTGASVSGSSYSISRSDLMKYKRMAIIGDKVGIGTDIPDERLTVRGNIHAQGVKVDLTGPLADYVFKSNYHLTPLTELSTYVKHYHHLPEIPSAEQVAKNGLNLGEMNEKLLKKVEELTLYLIEKDKQLQEQQKTNQLQQADIRSQQKQINQLKKQFSKK